jgi:probable rRNA maturation factor
MGERLRFRAGVEVEVQIAPQFERSLSEGHLRPVGEQVLLLEGVSGQVTLVITGDESIQKLNRDYLGVDEPTDVLAFSAREEAGAFITAPDAGAYLGDVIVSYPRAIAQAAEQGHPVEQELNLLIVHGILHLLGYDHADEGEKAIMWPRQEAILHHLLDRHFADG